MHKSREEAYIDKKKRLEEALIQAMEWQDEIPDTEVNISG